MPPADLWEIAWIAGGSALLVGLFGLGIAWLTRHRSIRWQLLVIAVIAAGGTYAGALAIAYRMFLSPHDLKVITVVISVSAFVGIIAALLVGFAMVADTRRLERVLKEVQPGTTTAPEVTGSQEVRQLSAALADALGRLDDAHRRQALLEASRRELVSWVSHDLRTPLAGLRAMAEALEDGIAADPARYHRQIRDEVDRLSALVDDLFELSRIQAGVVALSPESVSLGDAISEAIASAEPVARASGVHLAGHCDDGLAVEADPGRLDRVISNLIINAIRHTPREGVVTVVGRKVEDGVELSVADECGGLSPEALDRAFDVGWQGEAARSRQDPTLGRGAGIGLAIVKGTAEAHGGHVHAANLDSRLGCRFAVVFP